MIAQIQPAEPAEELDSGELPQAVPKKPMRRRIGLIQLAAILLLYLALSWLGVSSFAAAAVSTVIVLVFYMLMSVRAQRRGKFEKPKSIWLAIIILLAVVLLAFIAAFFIIFPETPEIPTAAELALMSLLFNAIMVTVTVFLWVCVFYSFYYTFKSIKSGRIEMLEAHVVDRELQENIRGFDPYAKYTKNAPGLWFRLWFYIANIIFFLFAVIVLIGALLFTMFTMSLMGFPEPLASYQAVLSDFVGSECDETCTGACSTVPTTNIDMVWDDGRREYYYYSTDACMDYRCREGNEISATCYKKAECDAACNGTCINIQNSKACWWP